MKFKKGDVVELVKTEQLVDSMHYKHDQGLIGKTGTVREILDIPTEGHPVRVKFGGHKEHCGSCVFRSRELRKASKEKAALYKLRR